MCAARGCVLDSHVFVAQSCGVLLRPMRLLSTSSLYSHSLFLEGITQTSGDGTPLSPPQIPLESLSDILSWVTQSGVCTLSGPSSYIHTLAEW